jgi:hypothetical protein
MEKTETNTSRDVHHYYLLLLLINKHILLLLTDVMQV